MKSVVWFVVAALVLVGAAGRAHADFYQVSGTFGAVLPGFPPSILAGGSYDGTYSATGLPLAFGTTGQMQSFDVNIRDAQGNLVYTLNSSVPGSTGDLFASSSQIVGRDLIRFANFAAGVSLQLDFPTPFNGVGTVIPSDLTQFESILNYGNNAIGVASGVSELAVPEPSSLALAGVGGLVALSATMLRRRRHASA